jgi:hypothetical protein
MDGKPSAIYVHVCVCVSVSVYVWSPVWKWTISQSLNKLPLRFNISRVILI